MYNEVFDEVFDEVLGEVEISESEEFTIDTDEKAEWALKKVLAAKKEKERLLALIDAEHDRLDQKGDAVCKQYENETSYLLFKLGEYFRTVEHKETKTQESYQLLSGKLIFKKPTQKIEPDEEAFLAWCKQNAPEYVRQKESVAWGDIKKQMVVDGNTVIYGATGEVVTGVSVTETAGVFDVKA